MTTATIEKSTSSRGDFVRGRLASLLAIAPLSVWTVMHLWNNLSAFKGAEAWEAAVTHHPHPLSQLITLILVMVPLLIHTVWGLSRIGKARVNANYTFFSNLKFVLQRLSALGLLGFLCAHIFLAMIKPRVFDGAPESFADLTNEMHHHTPTLVVYLLGTLAVSYHLANGIATFCMGFGVVSSRKALKKVDLLSYGLFALLLCMSWSAIYALWAAGA